jgi:localization factor PodJL
MTASVPWSVNAVDPEAWADARDAARRAGLSVGEWLESAIRDAANEQGRPPRRASITPSPDVIERRLDDIAERLDLFARRAAGPAARRTRGEAALQHSIDELNERIDRLAREMRADDRNGPAEIRAAIQRLEDRIDDLATRERIASARVPVELERKLETISQTIDSMSRRLELENRRYAASSVPSSVEELDHAVAEIMMRQSALDGMPPLPHETRRRASVPSGPDLSGLENQLKLITEEMRALRRAGLQSESIEALRQEFRDLAAKLGELAPRRSLESLERTIESVVQRIDRASATRPDETLTEVVDALHDIRAALADVRPAESFKSVERDLHELSSKLDNLNLQGVDDRTVARLQLQTAEIRELLSSALPSDVLKALVDQIELLVHKFEDGGSTGANSAIVDVLEGFERRIDTLSERIEAASRQGPAPAVLDDIRARLDELHGAMTKIERRDDSEVEAALRELAQRVEATDARLGNLNSIERGLKDLAAQLQEVRANTIATLGSPKSPVQHETTMPAAEIDRPHRSLEGRDAKPAPRVVAVRAETTSSTPPKPAATLETAEGIPPDLPLEPGSGPPRMRLQSAALRVAQSEAALGEIGDAPKGTAVRTSDFIAAARRAAQAATNEPIAEPKKRETAAERGGLGSVFGNTRRTLLIALTAFLLIFAALRFVDFQSLIPLRSESPASSSNAPMPANPPAAVPARPETPAATQQNQSHIAVPGADKFASLPASGVVGVEHRLPFLNENADPSTTGSTVEAKPTGAIQTAAAPAGTEAAPDGEGGLPSGIGTPALRAAAIAGDPVAAYEIGVRYLEGRGTRANLSEATSWLERAAAKGSMPAAYRLGSIYEKGAGSAKNSAEAMRYYMIAAEGGTIKAMHNLAVMIAEGANGKPDYRAAARWFRMAAERGVRDSQYNLGVLYARGLGVEQNLAESFRWFSLAANQGDADAAGKREDVAKRLDAQSLVAAKLAVQTWQPAAIDAAANEVQLKPEWDKAAEATPRKRTVKK